MRKQPLSMLVIDDDPQDVHIVRRLLKETPLWEKQFHAVGTGEEALAVLAEREFDVVFLDYLLGEQTGLSLLAPILETGHARAVIMLTGQGSEEIAVQAMKDGAMDYLVKDNLVGEHLRHAVLNALEKAGLRRTIQQQQEALLDAERHRVMIESLGAVCHHLGQPLSAMVLNLRALKETVQIADPKKQALLDQCLKATQHFAEVFSKIREVRQYRTTPYISDVQILDIGMATDEQIAATRPHKD